MKEMEYVAKGMTLRIVANMKRKEAVLASGYNIKGHRGLPFLDVTVYLIITFVSFTGQFLLTYIDYFDRVLLLGSFNHFSLF